MTSVGYLAGHSSDPRPTARARPVKKTRHQKLSFRDRGQLSAILLVFRTPRQSSAGEMARAGAIFRRRHRTRHETRLGGWGARIRTWEWRNQNPLPYLLATPHRRPNS